MQVEEEDVDYQVAEEDLALAVVPGSNFNPKTRQNVTAACTHRVILSTYFCRFISLKRYAIQSYYGVCYGCNITQFCF
jgi:hypothetical protein